MRLLLYRQGIPRCWARDCEAQWTHAYYRNSLAYSLYVLQRSQTQTVFEEQQNYRQDYMTIISLMQTRRYQTTPPLSCILIVFVMKRGR